MSLMDYFRQKFGGAKNIGYAETQSGRAPLYSQFGDDIYASEVVLQAVRCIVNEIKKLKPRHVIETTDSLQVQAGDIAAMLTKPNEFMTLSDFLENITYQLFKNYNVFIYPMYVQAGNVRKYTGLYPLKPSQVDFLQDDAGQLFVKFSFANGQQYTLPYGDVIHWRYEFSTADFMGGGADGKPDNSALIETLQLNKNVRNALVKAAQSPVNGVVRYGSVISENKLAEKVDEFNAALKKNESGILQLDAKSEFQQLANGLKLVDKDTMEFIKQEIVDHFGVSLPMLHSVATVEEKQAFYDKTIEPLIESLNQCFTDCLITDGRRDRNHKIVFYEKDLLFMTMEQKIEFVKEMGQRGALTNNQILALFGMPPYEGGDVRLQSLNYVDVSIANNYQLNNAGATTNTTTQTTTNTTTTTAPTETEGAGND